ncbi:MAG: hypothetical protein AAFW73_26055 [Bacteroidota bacterium]
MKQCSLLGLVVLMSVLFSACDNELELVTEWKDIPVVYGLIDRQDSVHLIRIEKAFIDPQNSALELAQIPDSLYYDNLTAQIKILRTEEVFTLERVNGDDEGFPREDGGAFATSPNFLYKLVLPGDRRFNSGERLQLILNRGDDLELVTAETSVASDLDLVSPNQNLNRNIQFNTNFNAGWKFATEDTDIFDLSFILHYEERDVNESEWLPRTLTWDLARSIIPDENSNGTQTRTIPGNDLFRFMGSNIDVVPGMIRRFVSVSVRVDGGGPEVRRYIEQGKVNTGITSSQVIPTYTNLSEGFGVFSSTNTVLVDGFILNTRSRDSLRIGQFTAPLNFQ